MHKRGKDLIEGEVRQRAPWRLVDEAYCVATITGLPTLLHALTIILCAANTLLYGISYQREQVLSIEGANPGNLALC